METLCESLPTSIRRLYNSFEGFGKPQFAAGKLPRNSAEPNYKFSQKLSNKITERIKELWKLQE